MRLQRFPSGCRSVAAALGLLGVLLSSCTTAVQQVDPAAWMVNFTSRTIHRLAYRVCGAGQDGWMDAAEIDLPPGSAMQLHFPADCVDVRVWNVAGKMVGTQLGLRAGTPFRWEIH